MIAQLILVLLFIVLLVKSCRRPFNFPPGPRGLPLVGYVPFVTKHDPVYPFRAMIKMSQIYGPVVGFYLGPSQPFVAVCGYDACKEALLNDDLVARPEFKSVKERTFNKKLGIIFTDGDFWREQRRFTLRHLRDLGFGRTSIESVMLEEIGDLVRDIGAESESDPHRVVDMKGKFSVSVINVLWNVVAGHRFRRDDAQFQKLVTITELFFSSGNPLRAAINIPIFMYRIFPWLRKLTGARGDLVKQLMDFFEEALQKHEDDQVQDEPRDFFDVYIAEMKKQSTQSSFQREQLLAIILDLFFAGLHTTTNSVGFVLLYLIHYPEVQKKMQRELDQVCGSGLPSLSHRNDLKYTEAVLMEVQRISSVAPTTVPHCALKDTQVYGYTIPKGAVVQINLHSVHNEKSYWGDPEVFRPERHFNAEGKVEKTDHFIPFAIGKRMCLGEALARNSYFLFTAALVKKFSFSPVTDEPLPTLEPINGFALGYDGFKAVVCIRS